MAYALKLKDGYTTIVDEDFDQSLLEYPWALNYKGYVNVGMYDQGDRTTVFLHRLIMDAPKGMEVDHINGDRLDNRRENLRVCTGSDNAQNRKMRSNNRLGIRGVSKLHGRFVSEIGVGGKRIYLGSFTTPEEAAAAYREAAQEYHGEFSRLNSDVSEPFINGELTLAVRKTRSDNSTGYRSVSRHCKDCTNFRFQKNGSYSRVYPSPELAYAALLDLEEVL